MCGSWGAAKCTPKRWYFFMGDVNEDFVPFQINYQTQKLRAEFEGFDLLSPRIVPCNESVDVRTHIFME